MNGWEAGKETLPFAKLGSSLCLNCHRCNRTSRAYKEDDRLLSGLETKWQKLPRVSPLCASVCKVRKKEPGIKALFRSSMLAGSLLLGSFVLRDFKRKFNTF